MTMTDSLLLSDAALGDLAAILPGTALADGTGGAIGPDPDARPRQPRDVPELERPEREPPVLPWKPSGIGVRVLIPDLGLEGFADFGTRRQRISPSVISVRPGDRFFLQVFFYVDAVERPRPLPFQPPQVGLQWYFTPDGGDQSDTSVSWDAAPSYTGPGRPLLPNFHTSVGFVVPENGWLTLSARIDDPEGAAEFDDTIRLLIVK